jgi:hypothetical protein
MFDPSARTPGLPAGARGLRTRRSAKVQFPAWDYERFAIDFWTDVADLARSASTDWTARRPSGPY